MKILVTYYSKTGNTKQIAEAICEALAGEEPAIMPLGEVENPGEYALIFCGFPVHAHSVPVPVHDFIKNIPGGVNLALFSTHGAHRASHMAKEAIHHATSLAKNTKVLGSFTCRGKVETQILESLDTKPEHRAWVHEARSAHPHPDKADLEDAQVFARDMLKRAMPFEDFHKK